MAFAQRGLYGLLMIWTLVGCHRPNNAETTVADRSARPPQTSLAHAAIENLQLVDGVENEMPPESTDLRVLFIGNSHSSPIPLLLTRIFKRQQPGLKTFIRSAPSFGFLVDHANSKKTLKLIRTGNWDFVVLQAQKYSTSGKYTYPTDGALMLSKIATESGAKIVMYPEWSRQGVPEEYQRIKSIHNKIAKKTGAQVAPIGEAWETASATLDAKKLYAPDGNHASKQGSYLNACVFYSMITGESPIQAAESKSRAFPKSYRDLEQAAWSAYSKQRSSESSKK